MSQTPDDARGFWYYTGIILGTCFAGVAIIAAVAVVGLLSHALVLVFLFGWRTF
jgi:hypothetical protein